MDAEQLWKDAVALQREVLARKNGAGGGVALGQASFSVEDLQVNGGGVRGGQGTGGGPLCGVTGLQVRRGCRGAGGGPGCCRLRMCVLLCASGRLCSGPGTWWVMGGGC